MCASAFFPFRRLLGLALAVASQTATFPAQAFSLSPSGTAAERHQAATNAAWYERYISGATLWGIHIFREPVHEEITQRMFGCQLEAACKDPDNEDAPREVIAGARWNDDPPFKLTTTSISSCRTDNTIRVVTQPTCWYNLFKDAEKKAKTTYFDGQSSWPILYRSHFGDLQFLHSMASRDGESARETQKRILMWAEFAWSVATGAQNAKTLVKDVKVEGLSAYFARSGQSVADLFTLGNPSLRRGITGVAFGSLLHVVEDSFAFAHADRAAPVSSAKCPGTDYPRPGAIRSFRSYGGQDHKIHGGYDSRASFQASLKNSPTVLDVGQVLVDMYYEQKAGWDVAGPYLQCIFDVENGDAPGAAGEGLEPGQRQSPAPGWPGGNDLSGG